MDCLFYISVSDKMCSSPAHLIIVSIFGLCDAIMYIMYEFLVPDLLIGFPLFIPPRSR